MTTAGELLSMLLLAVLAAAALVVAFRRVHRAAGELRGDTRVLSNLDARRSSRSRITLTNQETSR